MTKLETMLKYVSEHNEFYKNRIKEYGIKDPLDITQWPILTRKELQENRYNIWGTNSQEYNEFCSPILIVFKMLLCSNSALLLSTYVD